MKISMQSHSVRNVNILSLGDKDKNDGNFSTNILPLTGRSSHAFTYKFTACKKYSTEKISTQGDIHLAAYQYFAVLILLCGMTGCGSNVKFGGRVTFSDDDSPLTTGMVCFESNSFLARGPLDPDGCYDLGSLTLNDGIPKGEYRVYISGADAVEEATVTHVPGQAEYVTSSSVRGAMAGQIFTPLIDPKFTRGKTSGLTVTIDGSSKKFDFQVDRYQPKK